MSLTAILFGCGGSGSPPADINRAVPERQLATDPASELAAIAFKRGESDGFAGRAKAERAVAYRRGWSEGHHRCIYDARDAVKIRDPTALDRSAGCRQARWARQRLAAMPREEYRVGAICVDGWESDATGQGACSHHGGVDYWLVEKQIVSLEREREIKAQKAEDRRMTERAAARERALEREARAAERKAKAEVAPQSVSWTRIWLSWTR